MELGSWCSSRNQSFYWCQNYVKAGYGRTLSLNELGDRIKDPWMETAVEEDHERKEENFQLFIEY
ncbi:hypothetical protein Dsin_013716 [Dipteronia sinensis]|uniref:Uncharacterized protein n=1 Tax=Dipteronia sinensis TaxID=43782 RepID=A0AAE0AKF3_9ROSI|nr:hypothetical protein Dsin_013716 [Dipteronia sinensis]